MAPMHEREGAPGHSHAEGDPDQDASHAPDHGHSEDGRPRIAFVGAGRVGTALAVALARAGWDVVAVASRDEAARDRFAGLVPGARRFSEPQAVLDEAELVFLTVPDDAVVVWQGGSTQAANSAICSSLRRKSSLNPKRG